MHAKTMRTIPLAIIASGSATPRGLPCRIRRMLDEKPKRFG
jgi:hypothetical protein